MGGTRWEYVTPFQGSVAATLAALQQEVFERLNGDGKKYGSLEELYTHQGFMREQGTHTILDVPRIVETSALPQETDPADFFTIRPLAPARLLVHFDSQRPTVRQWLDALDMGFSAVQDWRESLLGDFELRWTGFYVFLYTGDEPTHVGFFGLSGD